MEKLYIGIDLGGTYIKGGIIDDKGKIKAFKEVPSERQSGAEKVTNNIIDLVNGLVLESGLTIKDICGLGVGVPGIVNQKTGTVIFATNLKWENYPLARILKEKLNFDKEIKIGNDANLALIGEYKFGAGKNYKDLVFITLGTGVGGGVISDGKLITGNGGAGAELGHSVIVAGGRKCNCGRKGCFERYASANALISYAVEEVRKNPASLMNGLRITGKTPFEYYEKDESAKKAVDKYIYYLALGLINYANIFRPQIILLGGGISKEGEKLIKPLEEFMKNELFAYGKAPDVEIKISSLKNDAGFIGAAAQFIEN